MNRQELLDALVAERYNGGGWTSPSTDEKPALEFDDHDLTIARRRRELLAEVALHHDDEEASA